MTFVWRVAAAASVGVAALAAQQRPLPDPQQFVRETRSRLETDDQRQSGYVYVETRRVQKLDKGGRPTSESVKVFESYPALPGEERWDRLLSEDGKPVPPQQLQKEDADRRKHAEDYARKAARDPEAERARLDREREKDRRERSEAIDDALRVFDIRMAGREAIDGHDTILFTLTPRADAKPRTRAGSIARNFAGRAWISESDYELVRLELRAVDTVSIGFGLLARLHKGSELSFERRKINDEAWLPATAHFSLTARIGLLAVVRRGATVEFSDYKKFGVDTSTTIALPRKR